MLCFAFSQAQEGYNFKFEKDKQLHFGYSVPIGMPAYFLGSDILHSFNIDVVHKNRFLRIISGGVIVSGINTIKEVTDIGKTGFNKYDIFYGTIGGLAGSALTDILFYKNWKNNKIEEVRVF